MLLVDTHVLLWWLADDDRLTAPMRSAMAEAGMRVFVSAASVWEMAIKSQLGKLSIPEGLDGEMERQGFEELVVTHADALAAGSLPPHHADPFDRMLIAQAARRDLVLVSADRRFAGYDVRLLR